MIFTSLYVFLIMNKELPLNKILFTRQAILIIASHHPKFDELFYKASLHFTMVCHRATSIRSGYDNNNTWVPTSFTLYLITCMPKLFRGKKKKRKTLKQKKKAFIFLHRK